MPQIDFDPAHKKNGFVEFDKLKLKKDERARILVIEKPTYAYVHDLRKPKIIDGQPVKVWRDKRGNSGEKEEVYDLDFVGRPLCLGDLTVIEEKGLDENNCPACARARKNDDVDPPTRRFAMNVIKYALRADGTLVQPFSCQCVVWNFTEKKFNDLVGVAAEHEGLVGVDLVLGPCVSETFQNFPIQGSPRHFWKNNEETQRIVKETYEANRIADLEATCGRRQDKRFMEYDIDSIIEAWRIVNGGGSPEPATSLVGSEGKASAYRPMAMSDSSSVGSGNFGDSMAALVNDAKPAPAADTKDTPNGTALTHNEPAAADAMNFEDLLNRLNN